MKKKEYQEFVLNMDSIPDQFKVLEEKVEQLVQRCNELQNAKSSLETTVANLQESLHAIRGKIAWIGLQGDLRIL